MAGKTETKRQRLISAIEDQVYQYDPEWGSGSNGEEVTAAIIEVLEEFGYLKRERKKK